MRLKNKVAIVTGGTSGIGKDAAIRMAAEGASVAIAGRNEERGKVIIDEIVQNGGKGFFCKTDMSSESDMDNLVGRTIEEYGKLDILFNNAGISDAAPLEETTKERWDNVIQTNLTAPFLMAKKAMPHLIKTKGNILNTASVAGIKATMMAYAYASSKSGLIMLTKILAMDYADKGVRVNALCPGVTETPLVDTVPEEARKALIDTIPVKRLAEPEEMSNAVIFLVSDEASYITGQAIAVDGGFTV